MYIVYIKKSKFRKLRVCASASDYYTSTTGERYIGARMHERRINSAHMLAVRAGRRRPARVHYKFEKFVLFAIRFVYIVGTTLDIRNDGCKILCATLFP